MRILVVEDDVELARALATMLGGRKFAVDVAGDGNDGLEYLLRQQYDAAILDVVLPRRDGFTVARAARAEGIQTPILMLTSRDAVEDRVNGLDSGADDYLVKPFEEEELFARLRAIVRRAESPIQSIIRIGELFVNSGARSAHYAGKTLELGKTEFRLLEFLARNVGIAFTRAQLLERLWEYDFDGSSNIVDVYVSQLRRKLKRAGAGDLLQTVWGVGYRLADP